MPKGGISAEDLLNPAKAGEKEHALMMLIMTMSVMSRTTAKMFRMAQRQGHV